MPCAFSLILSLAMAQSAVQHAPAPAALTTKAPVAAPANVIIQCVPSDAERALGAELEETRAERDEARDQLAKLKVESGIAENALAALLLSNRPELASLRLFTHQYVPDGTRWVEIEVYVPRRGEETAVAVVVGLRNPRDKKAWEPTEAWVSAPCGRKACPSWFPPVQVAVRADPQQILPGQSARIVVVFDTNLGAVAGPLKVALKRDGKPEFEFELQSSDLRPAPGTGG